MRQRVHVRLHSHAYKITFGGFLRRNGLRNERIHDGPSRSCGHYSRRSMDTANNLVAGNAAPEDYGEMVSVRQSGCGDEFSRRSLADLGLRAPGRVSLCHCAGMERTCGAVAILFDLTRHRTLRLQSGGRANYSHSRTSSRKYSSWLSFQLFHCPRASAATGIYHDLSDGLWRSDGVRRLAIFRRRKSNRTDGLRGFVAVAIRGRGALRQENTISDYLLALRCLVRICAGDG